MNKENVIKRLCLILAAAAAVTGAVADEVDPTKHNTKYERPKLTPELFARAMKKAFKPLTPEEAYQQMIEFTKAIKSAWPHCKVGCIANLPKWRYSKEFDWNDTSGDSSAKFRLPVMLSST